MNSRLMDELQVRLNKLVRTEEFRQHILKYVDVIPNDFNISLSVDDNGEICDIWCGIIHYGYEHSSNKGLSIYDDLCDFWTSPSDPEISQALKDAAADYIYANLSLISDLLSRLK